MSTIKSSTEHLTLNADGSGKDIKFQANGVEKASISSTGVMTATSYAGDGSALTGVGGITEADQWRLTTSFTGDSNPITTNLERVDTDGFGKLGTGMSEASGVFSFPSTGVWKIEASAYFISTAANNYQGLEIHTTTDNSTYDNASHGFGSIHGSGAYSYVTPTFIFDVTNTSTHKVRFRVAVASGATAVTCYGDTGRNRTSFTFTKLGDT